MIDLASERKDYKLASLDEKSVGNDPITQFKKWLDEAVLAKVPEPTAMNLATVDEDGYPNGRIVLLKGLDAGFIFYTNYESAKGTQLRINAKAALTFHWVELERQVRVIGDVEKVNSEMSDHYFHSRPFDSQIAAAASPQSQVVNGREELERCFERLKQEYPETIERPSQWGGYRIIPKTIEFWQGRSNRLHDRLLFTHNGSMWSLKRLAP